MEKNSQTILITGGRSGLGRAIVETLLGQGFSVVATSRSFEQHFSCHLDHDQKLFKCHLDISSQQSIDNFFAQLSEQSITLKGLINNAGVGHFEKLKDLNNKQITEMLQVNFLGSVLFSKKILPFLEDNNGGRIINIGSIVESYPASGNTVYGATKSALKAFSKHLNEETKDKRVFTTHVELGGIYTEIWQGREGFSEKDMLSLVKVAEEIARIFRLPSDMRVDELKLYPTKGLL